MKAFNLLCLLTVSVCLHAQIAGSSLFNETRIIDVYLNFDDDDFWDDLVDTHEGDYYISCEVLIDGNVISNSGIKLKGNSSWGVMTNKKSFKIDFDEFVAGQEYDELETLVFNNNFKDPTMLREKIFYDFCNVANIPAPRANFAKVFMNDTYWGLYTMVDEVDKDYLGVLFSDNDGNLYKGDPSGDLSYLGEYATPYYGKYELKTNEDSADWTDLIDFIERINNSSDTDFENAVSEKMDKTDFYGHWCADNLFSNLDSYLGSGHNYYLYHEPSSDEFKFIIWDGNEAFGNFSNGIPNEELSEMSLLYLPSYPKVRPIIERAMENDSMLHEYLNTIYILKEAYFNPAYLFPVISADSALIRAAVYDDPQKQYSFELFEENINYNVVPFGAPLANVFPGLKQFITERYNYITDELNSLGFIPSSLELHDLTTAINVYPTLVKRSENIIIKVSSGEMMVVQLYDCNGQLLSADSFTNEFLLSTYTLNAGMYILSLISESGYQQSFKCIVQE